MRRKRLGPHRPARPSLEVLGKALLSDVGIAAEPCEDDVVVAAAELGVAPARILMQATSDT